MKAFGAVYLDAGKFYLSIKLLDSVRFFGIEIEVIGPSCGDVSVLAFLRSSYIRYFF